MLMGQIPSHKVSSEFFHETQYVHECVCVCVSVDAKLQNKPAEPERLALAVHVLNVGMVVSVYRGVLNLLSMSHGHLHTLYTFTQLVWVTDASHTDTHFCLVTSVCKFILYERLGKRWVYMCVCISEKETVLEHTDMVPFGFFLVSFAVDHKITVEKISLCIESLLTS